MIVKNLTQLKKAIEARTPFEIVKHYIHPYTGQIRVPNVVQTNGFYSVTRDDVKNEVNMFNGGKGVWMPYGKASDWKFDGESITAFTTRYEYKTDNAGVVYRDYHDEPVMTIRFLEKEN